MAQFKPVELSFGIEEGRDSESEVVVRDMVSTRIHKYEQRLIWGLSTGGRAHNILETKCDGSVFDKTNNYNCST